MSVRKIIEIVLLAIIFGFMVSAAFLVFTDVFSATDTSAREGFHGAFMGAFFAFLFVRFSQGLTKIYDRRAKNHTALVRLQYHFNDCLNLIGDNVYVIDTYFSVFEGYGPSAPEPKIFGNELHQIPIEKELVVSLTNIEFINEVYTLHVELRKLNDSMNTTNRMINQTTRAFIEKHIDHQTYAANIEHYKPILKELRKFSFAAKKDIEKVFATARVLLRDEHFLSRVIQAVMPTKYTKSQLKQIPIEIKVLEQEMENIGKESGERINAVRREDY